MRARSNPQQCIRCKGRGHCGKPFCPIFAKAEAMFKVKEMTGKDFTGTSPPSVFIGRHNYPNVNVGVLSPVFQSSEAWKLDSVNHWINEKKKIEDVVKYRSSLVNSRTKSNIKQTNKFMDLIQEIGASTEEVDVEITLKKKPVPRVTLNPEAMPSGPSAEIEKVEATSNIKIKRPVQKVIDDTDLKSVDALQYLKKKGFDFYTLQKILSVGVLGLKNNRKMIPTRWSITATDDALGKNLLQKIKNYPTINWFEVHHGGFFGNRFTIILMPKYWGYELFECLVNLWPGELVYTTDQEGYRGRKSYANNCAGGYYATRLSVLEYLEKIRRQAMVLVIREISNEYWVPLGVWVVREAVKKAMNNRRTFETWEQTMNYAQPLLRINSSEIWSKSHVLKEMKQKTVLDFL
ncbi:MAG: hypothetical protein GOU97_03135 [Nanoarchaeota archaeon]|nr:hypothetical protein [Nanoarchaeota archaeon]